MKILYITLENLSLHKGSVIHIKEIVTGLQNLGHQMGLVASSFNKYEKSDKFHNLHQTPISWLKLFGLGRQPYIISSIFLFLYLFKILPQYEIIYARDYHTVIIAILPRLLFKKKLVFEINGIANEEQRLKRDSLINRVLAFFIKKAEKMATQYADQIISVTPQISAYLSQHFNCPKEKVEIISNGVNIRKFRPIHDETILLNWRRKLGISEEEIVVAFVGNLAPWQGVNLLVDGALRLLSKDKYLKFLIVGDGLLRPALVKKVLDSGFDKNFILTGMVNNEDIPYIINIADICAAPFILKRNQKTGVSPLKIFEYMACGKPIIASRIEGLEFIEAEGAGLLVEPEDVKELEKALYLLIREPQVRIKMGGKGLQIARERFDWELKVAKIEEILERLV